SFQFRLWNLEDSTPISPGVAFDGNLTEPATSEFYEFHAAAGEELYIDVVSASQPNRATIRLLDPLGKAVSGIINLRDFQTAPLPLTGTYRLLVEGKIASEAQGAYSLDVIPVTRGAFPIELNDHIEGAIQRPGQQQEYF